MSGDPFYSHPTYRALQRYWRGKHRHERLRCARCGITLRRGTPRGDDSMDVGHIVGRHLALSLGWSIEQVNHVSNSQPECQACNRTMGALYGNSVRGRALPQPVTSTEW